MLVTIRREKCFKYNWRLTVYLHSQNHLTMIYSGDPSIPYDSIFLIIGTDQMFVTPIKMLLLPLSRCYHMMQELSTPSPPLSVVGPHLHATLSQHRPTLTSVASRVYYGLLCTWAVYLEFSVSHSPLLLPLITCYVSLCLIHYI